MWYGWVYVRRETGEIMSGDTRFAGGAKRERDKARVTRVRTI